MLNDARTSVAAVRGVGDCDDAVVVPPAVAPLAAVPLYGAVSAGAAPADADAGTDVVPFAVPLLAREAHSGRVLLDGEVWGATPFTPPPLPPPLPAACVDLDVAAVGAGAAYDAPAPNCSCCAKRALKGRLSLLDASAGDANSPAVLSSVRGAAARGVPVVRNSRSSDSASIAPAASRLGPTTTGHAGFHAVSPLPAARAP